MLTRIRIKNFAIIDSLELEFDKGLNILTGETGAGKSIIIDALGLILGNRLSEDMLRAGEESGEVEALFTISPREALFDLLNDSGIDSDENSILIRRTFSESKRNRIYINNVSVTANLLKEVGDLLVDIHGQHDHETLLKASNHIFVLDAYGGLDEERKSLSKKTAILKSKEEELNKIFKMEKERAEQIDLLKFQLDEINKVNISTYDEEEFEKRKKLIQNSEQRSHLAGNVYCKLYEDENASLGKLSTALKELKALQQLDESVNKDTENLESAFYAIEDVANNIRNYLDCLNFDPNELSEIDNRIAEVNGLKRKYGNSLESIINKKEQIEKRLLDFDNSAFQKESLSSEISEIQNEISKLAIALAKKREKAGKTFKGEVERELKELNMEKVTFEPIFSYKESEDSFVSFNGKKSDINSLGLGEIEFFFSSNAGQEVKPLAKIASGGELSRIMLALKKVLAGKDSIPVLIFDEIDTGISGSTAEIVGKKIKEVAKEHQVFCVTHLPQIASKGDAHFLIRKQVSNNKTVVEAVKISGSSRVDEIARMAGGIKITETTRKHAHEMITGSN